MKEKLTEFEQRKIDLESKLQALSASVDKKLSYNMQYLNENVDS